MNNDHGKNSYNLSASERGQEMTYKGHTCRIYGQMTVIYSQNDTRKAIWQVLGEWDEAKRAIDLQEWQ